MIYYSLKFFPVEVIHRIEHLVKIWCFFLNFSNKFQGPEKEQEITKIAIFNFSGLRIKYYFVNFFLLDFLHGIEQLVKIWQLFLVAQTSFNGPRMVKINWKWQFSAFSSKFLDLEMGNFYLRFYTAESRPGGEGHVQKILRKIITF